MIQSACPECKQLIEITADPEIGQQFLCTACDTVFEVTWLFPISLDYLEASYQAPVCGSANPNETE